MGRLGIVAVGLGLGMGILGTACGGDGGGQVLRPAAEVNYERLTQDAIPLVPGAQVEVRATYFPSGHQYEVNVTVTDFDYSGPRPTEEFADPAKFPSGGRWLTLQVRVENVGDTDVPLGPDFNIYCANGVEGSRYSIYGEREAELGPPYEFSDPLPAHTFAEGALLFGVPDNCGKRSLVVEPTGAFSGESHPGVLELPEAP
jgi:hypothetical protein